MKLRYATPADADAIGRYHHRCWVEELADLLAPGALDGLRVDDRVAAWRDRLDGAESTTVVTEVDGVAVGHVTVSDGELTNLFVDPDHWRAGIGGELLAVGERLLLRAGHAEAELYTVHNNERAIAFYQRAGWQLDGATRSESMFGVELDEVRLTKTLTLDQLVRNRAYWNDEAAGYVDHGRRSWGSSPAWGIFGIDDADVGFLPEVVDCDVIELGCGTGYVSAWCSRAGARSVIGLDNSPAQLATAHRLQLDFGLRFPLVWGDAEQTPFSDDSFDVAINEYGAAIWCDPHRWIPEAARILRPGGILAFHGNSALMMLCVSDFEDETATAELRRPQRGMHRFIWPDTVNVEYHVSHGDMIRILRRNGFEILDLIELYAPPDAESFVGFVDGAWASQWPAEEAWIARLATGS